MSVKQKLLKEFEYKGYKVEILGEFTTDYRIRYNSEWYEGAIFPKLIISKDGVVYSNIGFYELSDRYMNVYSQSEILASFKVKYEKTFWSSVFKTKGKAIGLIHIKDDYHRFINVIESIGKERVDRLFKQHDLENFEKSITDGLPDSLSSL